MHFGASFSEAKNGSMGSRRLLKQFVARNPEHPEASRCVFLLGTLFLVGFIGHTTSKPNLE